MDYALLKSLHIIFIVTWFAGLFYIVRLFIYHTEAASMPEPDSSILKKQFEKMEYLLWNVITQPSMVLTLVLGPLLAYQIGLLDSKESLIANPWFLVKIAFVVVLLIYHGLCHIMIQLLKRGEFRFTSTQLRMFNEIATVLLVAIVFLVVYKNSLSAAKAIAGFIVITLALFAAIQLVKKIRKP